jgi:hypothetical protein
VLEISNKEYKVNGYSNRWSVIDILGDYALLENCTYGDDACYLVVRRSVKITDKTYHSIKTGEPIVLPCIHEVVCDTYDDLQTALEDLCLL